MRIELTYPVWKTGILTIVLISRFKISYTIQALSNAPMLHSPVLQEVCSPL